MMFRTRRGGLLRRAAAPDSAEQSPQPGSPAKPQPSEWLPAPLSAGVAHAAESDPPASSAPSQSEDPSHNGSASALRQEEPKASGPETTLAKEWVPDSPALAPTAPEAAASAGQPSQWLPPGFGEPSLAHEQTEPQIRAVDQADAAPDSQVNGAYPAEAPVQTAGAAAARWVLPELEAPAATAVLAPSVVQPEPAPETGPDSSPAVPQGPESPPHRPRRRRLLIAVLVAAVALLGGVGAALALTAGSSGHDSAVRSSTRAATEIRPSAPQRVAIRHRPLRSRHHRRTHHATTVTPPPTTTQSTATQPTVTQPAQPTSAQPPTPTPSPPHPPARRLARHPTTSTAPQIGGGQPPVSTGPPQPLG